MQEPLNLTKFGFHRVATAVPELQLAKPKVNGERILALAKKAAQAGAEVVVFPELALSGYTCEDLFHNQDLLQEVNYALLQLVSESRSLPTVLVVGLPYQSADGRLYNCAAVIYQGDLLGLVPKTHLPNYNEFYEKRWFVSGLETDEEVMWYSRKVRLCARQIFNINDEIKLAVEICEDLWAPLPPSTHHALAGANLMVNLTASNELVGKSEYRRELVKQQSARLNCAYVYVSSGPYESSKDVVFGGHALFAENGSLLLEGERFNFTKQLHVIELDFQKINLERRRNTTSSSQRTTQVYYQQQINNAPRLTDLRRQYSPNPFVPADPETFKLRMQEILTIQSVGLARRLRSLKHPKLVLGLSGGLDSTLALLVGLEALRINGRPVTDLIALSMPGFGTSKRTREQAEKLAAEAGVTFKEIDITESVRAHFKAIGHKESETNVVYENAQARERTQILFDCANKYQGIVLGTGDLSELALGWCTYNGDHMSSYNVNASIPKTLVRFLVEHYIQLHPHLSTGFAAVLQAVVKTKISPELLPTNRRREITQSTEDLIGPYELHDFFLFHYLRNGFGVAKIEYLATITFGGKYSAKEVKKWLGEFTRRFKQQQFKRTTLPAGPKVGSVSLSPRGDWRMPDETGE